MAALLETCAITKRFPGVTALNAVTFDLQTGEVHALCGENGAGKSTLIKLLSGLHPHGTYEGELRVDGRPVKFTSIMDAQNHGVAVIYQELALVPELSIAENLFLGCEPRRGLLINWEKIHQDTRDILAKVGLELSPETPVGQLGIGQQQLIEIAKALGKQARILILDEPTAALTEKEVSTLLELIRDLHRHGLACIYISHKLDEVFALADRITVLRDGATVSTLNAAETSKARVIRDMVGREIKDFFPRIATTPGDILLQVDHLSATGGAHGPVQLHDISFAVRAGEVLGIGGLMGAGRTELLMHIFGAWGIRLGGEITLAGSPLGATTPESALFAGLALVSEDRKRFGLILERDIGFNLSLSSITQLRRGALINEEAETRENQKYFSSLRVKAPSLETTVGTLSGGNQQKVVIGKALMTEPRVIFLDEPTRGIDVGAKLEVYELINRFTAEGRAVVLVSSELPELMGMSDRILMLHSGQVGGVFTRNTATPEKLLAAAMGREPSAA
ncbi:MAG: ATP-binding cassette domain-containing protein [Cephaloticoccus sp.]|nr:ATP-binding cassette domain-containing protein [Cephaloticoccus sp.]MCF7758946.1 ATP-binding cassette domain-containing protein [Cephaloticoccus sp.]